MSVRDPKPGEAGKVIGVTQQSSTTDNKLQVGQIVFNGAGSAGDLLTYDGTNHQWTQSTWQLSVLDKMINRIKEKYELTDDEAVEWIFEKLDAVHQMQEAAVTQFDKKTNGE